MSKRTESKKVAVFELEPDRFSIHTFELSKRLTMYEFQQVKPNDVCVGIRGTNYSKRGMGF